MITQEQLKKRLHYNPDTGVFTRLTCGASFRGKLGALSGKSKQTLILGHNLLLSRLAWLYMHGEWPTEVIDHVNGNDKDNRLENLRSATQQENSHNRRRPCMNTTGFKNVGFRKDCGWFFVQIRGQNKKQHYVPRFPTAEIANEFAGLMRIALHKEFANHGAVT